MGFFESTESGISRIVGLDNNGKIQYFLKVGKSDWGSKIILIVIYCLL